MARQHSGLQQFRQACQIARDYGMFVVDKGDTFFVYRKTPTGNVCLGKCGSTEALFRKVSNCAGSKSPRSAP